MNCIVECASCFVQRRILLYRLLIVAILYLNAMDKDYEEIKMLSTVAVVE